MAVNVQHKGSIGLISLEIRPRNTRLPHVLPCRMWSF